MNLSKKLKILMGTFAYKPAYAFGGPIQSVSAMAEELCNRGHSVTVFTSNAETPESDLNVKINIPIEVDGVKVYYCERKEPLKKHLPFIPYFADSAGFMYCPHIPKILKPSIRDYDVAIVQQPFTHPHLAVGHTALNANIPLLYYQRGVYNPESLQRRAFKKKVFISLFEKKLIARASRLIALNEVEKESYNKVVPGKDVEIINNGVDPAQYSKVTDTSAVSEFGINDSDQILLFLGRLNPIKNIDVLIRSFVSIADQYPGSKLVIAGPDEKQMQSELLRLIPVSLDKSRVVFTGMITGEVKKAMLSRADLFCLPSKREGSSLALMEALSSSLPCLVSPGCNMPLIQEYDAGWIVEPTVELWRSALSNALSMPGNLKAKGENSRRLIVENFSWSSLAEKLEAVIFDIICTNEAKQLA
jgi:glycosyltransferase involved in cell wall biosynthesis